MTVNPPTKEFFQSLKSADFSVSAAAVQLAGTLAMTAHALSKSPAAFVQLCQQLSPNDSAIEAVKKVQDQLQPLLGSIAAFDEGWSAVAQELLDQTRFFREAVNERNDAIGSELRHLNAKLAAEKSQAQAKRKALIDAGIDPEQAARLTPEPADTEHAEQTAALYGERAIFTKFGRTLDATLLPPTVHERAKEIELQKDWKVCPQAVTA